MTAPAVARCAGSLAIAPDPAPTEYGAVAAWTVGHPRYQVRMMFRWFAKVARDVTDGDLIQALEIYRWGDTQHGRGYSDAARKWWVRKLGMASWPKGGRLQRVGR